MAHSISSRKRVRQNAKRRVINRSRKSMIKTQIKHLESALSAENADQAKDQYKALVKKLDTVSTTSTLHKNTAARIKSRMARRVNALTAKTGG